MAKSIGTYLAGQQCEILYITRHADRIDDLTRHIDKTVRQLTRCGLVFVHPGCITLHEFRNTGTHYNDAIVIECLEESLAAKKDVFAQIATFFNGTNLLCSTTSSILPESIHPDCLGLHFFYPVELTGYVEIVVSSTTIQSKIAMMTDFCGEVQLRTCLQNENTAFWGNRLLLPLQNESIRLLNNGYDPMFVDTCAAGVLMPVGQLSLMDSIGLDTVVSSVCEYDRRYSIDCPLLIATLKSFVAQGKLGKKSHSGLMQYCHNTSADTQKGNDNLTASELSKQMHYLFINACLNCSDTMNISIQQINTFLSSVFQSSASLEESIEKEGVKNIHKVLKAAFRDSGMQYFIPSRLL
jgi:3-hydroxyacyl-CoA dehydrogenase